MYSRLVKPVKSIFEHAKKMGARVAWNPGNAELELGRSRLLPFLKQADIILLNREEAAQLANLAPRFLDQILEKLGVEIQTTSREQEGTKTYLKLTKM